MDAFMKDVLKEQLFDLIKVQPDCPLSCQVASFKNSIFVLPLNCTYLVLIKSVFPHIESVFFETFARYSNEESNLFTHHFHIPELKTFVYVMNLAGVLTLMRISTLLNENEDT
jgi:hypothetical protein